MIEHDPASMRAAARSADQRIEAALPAEARAEFRAWMQEHREHMMNRMRGGPMEHDAMHEREPGAMHSGDHEGRRCARRAAPAGSRTWARIGPVLP